MKIATFRADVTPPLGHPLCGGWIKPALAITDPLSALGVVLLPDDDDPIVLCAVDWCEMRNDAHSMWREAVASAVHTICDRVAVQCLHQHNAPLADLATERVIEQQQALPRLMDTDWFRKTVARVADAAHASLSAAQTVTHIGLGQARVEQVASNRRVKGSDGKIKVRTSATKDAALREAPEGLIDPMLKTVSFWNGDKKLAALHYYATHPMSYYGDGLVTWDFAGIARERRTAEDGVPHIYFTGCAGNITAGKYNDGAPENRAVLAGRIHRGMVESEQRVEREAVGRVTWRIKPVLLPPRPDLQEAELLKTINDTKQSGARRATTALFLSFLRRASEPILLTSLHIGKKFCVVHLPGEPFIEYQLFAQQQRPDGFVAVAGYGDCSTGYIPLAASFAEGGYEPTQASVGPQAETILKEGIAALVKA